MPATVVIPGGQSSATFAVQAADDSLLDGRQTLTISATAAGYMDGSVDLQVVDHEVSPSLSAIVDQRKTVARRRHATRSNTDNNAALTVSVLGSDASEAVVPATVTIPVGQPSVTFVITAQDDSLWMAHNR